MWRSISWQVNALSRLVDATLRPVAEESAESAGDGNPLLGRPGYEMLGRYKTTQTQSLAHSVSCFQT